ncbi:hypothetical protein JXA85_06510 [Candidatus Woesearchaeota archaeon]|nr:hypothetical protein [Candidatus Woesearchaeota archaeon]
MTILVAVLSTGKGTWSTLLRIIDAAEWDKIILVTNQFGKEKFSCKKPVEMIVLNFDAELEQLFSEMKNALEGKIPKLEMDVALNMESGSGKEHMALLSALLKLGFGIRMVTFKDGVKEV